jgi:protein O-mannosyl-transferase
MNSQNRTETRRRLPRCPSAILPASRRFVTTLFFLLMTGRLTKIGAYAAVALIAFAVYTPALWNGFVEFDDPDYVYRNPVVIEGLSAQGVAYAFTSIELANWFPLTLLSHQADVSLYGLNPAGHHLTNLLFHAVNAALLLSVLAAATRAFWPSLAVALLFAVHPLHVESVAWVAERKDMLGMFFALLTMRCYVAFAAGTRRAVAYIFAVFLFAAALMSKPMPVTLPFVLLLFDVWPLNRAAFGEGIAKRIGKLMLEKIPFFALTAASVGTTLYVQSRGGATTTLDVAIIDRLANAAQSYWLYIGDTIWPAGLSPIYPHPRGDVSVVHGVLGTFALVVVSIVAQLFWKHRGYIATGWFMFLGILVPMIGIVQVGYQARADRYMHFPMVGLFIIAVWLAWSWAGENKSRRRILAAVLALAAIGYGTVTVRQITFWKDSETLFNRALAVTEDNYFAHEELGALRYREGQLEEAEHHYRESLRLGPEAAALHANLAAITRNLGRPQDALTHAQRAVELAPDESAAHGNLGWVLRDLGQTQASAEAFARAIELDETNAGPHYGLALLLASTGQTVEAMQFVQNVLRLDPDHESAQQLLAQLESAAANP